MGVPKYYLLLVLFYSVPGTVTAEVFYTKCTRPPDNSTFNIVTAPNTRGSSEILWSCLFTLFIFSWQVQHPSVPPQNIRSVDRFWTKVTWILTTCWTPEIIFGVAFAEFVQARRSVRYMQRELPELVQQGGWTMTHAFYANMFGFMVKRRAAAESHVASTHLSSTSASTNNTKFEPCIIEQRDAFVLNTEKMIVYLESLPAPTAFTTEASIQRRANGNFVLKCIAGLQILWFIVQMCVRKATNLPISQLEVVVLAFALVTLLACFLWWKKPQDVSDPTFLDAGPGNFPISEVLFDVRNVETHVWYVGRTEHLKPIDLPFGLKVELVFLGHAVGGMILGAVQLLAWNLHFPTLLEKIAWRTCSMLTTTIPLFLLSHMVLHSKFQYPKVFGANVYPRICQMCLGLYILSKSVIYTETMRSFQFLPSTGYATTWSTYIPHLR